MTRLVFLCLAALNPSIWIQTCPAGCMREGGCRRGRRGIDENRRKKGGVEREERITDEMIQRERDGERGKRMWGGNGAA